MDKLERHWGKLDMFDGKLTDEMMWAAQRKAVFELLRDVAHYAKTHPNCHIQRFRFDPINETGVVGVEILNHSIYNKEDNHE